MTTVESNRVRILILTTRPSDLGPVAYFLNRRQYEVTIKDNLREAVALLVGNRPDWVFLSMNLSPAVDKFVPALKTSFNIEPVLFSDQMDRNTLNRLDQYKGHSLISKLTGPSIQLKIHQIMSEIKAAVRPVIADRPATSGVRKSDFDHNILLKGEGPRDSGRVIQMGAIESPNGRPGKVSPPDSAPEKPVSDERAASAEISVLIAQEEGRTGFLVMEGAAARAEASKKGLTGKLIGPLYADEMGAERFGELSAKLVKREAANMGEMLSCFVPDPNPLPSYQVSSADVNKLSVPLPEIPTDVPLPCPLYVYLPQNEKFVCLIKTGGSLSQMQRERLLKMGMQILVIAKADVESFNRFYVQSKLASMKQAFTKTA